MQEVKKWQLAKNVMVNLTETMSVKSLITSGAMDGMIGRPVEKEISVNTAPLRFSNCVTMTGIWSIQATSTIRTKGTDRGIIPGLH